MNPTAASRVGAAMPTVLIVEDEEMVREVAAAEFADAGFTVIEAGTGAVALALLEGGAAVDLLFTDVRLPGDMDGWAVARQARALHPALPVMYATGFPGDRLAMVEGGQLVGKPYRLPVIVAQARRLIDGRGALD